MAEPIRYNRMEHIFLREKPDTRKYKSIGQPIEPPPFPERDRLAHAERLEKEFDTAWKDSKDTARARHAQLLPARSGVYLEFKSMPGFGLKAVGLENQRQGVRLLSTRVINGTTLATIFVPNKQRKFVVNKLRRYRDEDTPKGRPKNQELIASVESIIPALLNSFCGEEFASIPEDQIEKCEIWLAGNDDAIRLEFISVCITLGIPLDEGHIKFRSLP